MSRYLRLLAGFFTCYLKESVFYKGRTVNHCSHQDIVARALQYTRLVLDYDEYLVTYIDKGYVTEKQQAPGYMRAICMVRTHNFIFAPHPGRSQ